MMVVEKAGRLADLWVTHSVDDLAVNSAASSVAMMAVETAAPSAVCLVVRKVGSMVGGSADLLVVHLVLSLAAKTAGEMADLLDDCSVGLMADLSAPRWEEKKVCYSAAHLVRCLAEKMVVRWVPSRVVTSAANWVDSRVQPMVALSVVY